ncbi:MAG: GerW family sporulation protein [Ectobacillus sp.]
MDHPIQGLMKAAMENLKEMVDVNTIIGEPVQTADGGVVLTVSKVAFGFGAGGSDFAPAGGTQLSENNAFGGGSGGGVSITPVAFLVVNGDGVNILHLQNTTHLMEKVIDLAPQTLDKLQTMFNQNMNQQTNQQGNNGLNDAPNSIL